MRSQVTAQRIGAGTLFKLLLIGSVIVHVVATLLVILLTVIGVLPLENTYGDADITASPLVVLLGYLVVGVVLSPLWAGIIWLSVWPGLWLYSLVRRIRIVYLSGDDGRGDQLRDAAGP